MPKKRSKANKEEIKCIRNLIHVYDMQTEYSKFIKYCKSVMGEDLELENRRMEAQLDSQE